MATRRRLLLFGLLACLLALSVGGWVLWPRPSAITRENAAKIQVGMTLDEVEAILGGPARREGPGGIGFMSGPPPVEWTADGLSICVWFNNDGQVFSCHVYADAGP